MGALEGKFTLQVPSSVENLAMIREYVSKIGTQAGLDETEVNMLELAVDEACANVIEHAYGDDKTKEVVIRANFDDQELRIDVEDSGRGFDPASVQQQELEQLVAARKSGGLGMRIIKTYMDEVRYEIEPGKKNVLRMTKRIRKS